VSQRVLGIDEAGRGCVLGDLVVAGFFVEALDDDTLRAAGAADSKKLSRKRRDAATNKLAALGEPCIERITPPQIDDGNLNLLEEEAIVRIVAHFRPDIVYMDALGPPASLPKLLKRLRAALPAGVDPEWVVEPKADHTYPVVGAASIFAKTTRDDALDDLARFGVLGSGYPSDPKTRTWLLQHARTGEPWPDFVRTRWQTVQDLAQQALL
jgi:ribonuclease HII